MRRLSKVASNAFPVRKAQGWQIRAGLAPAPESGRGRKGRRSRTLRRDKRRRRAGEDAACRCPRDSTECCALLLRTCNPSMRHRKRPAGSECRVLIPKRASEGGQQGQTGSGMAKLIPGGHREARRGSEMAILSPKWPWNGVRKGHLDSKAAILIPRSHLEGRAGSESRDLIPGWLSGAG